MKGIRSIGRNTQGVRLINLDEGDRVVDVARLGEKDADAIAGENGGPDVPDADEPASSADTKGDAGETDKE